LSSICTQRENSRAHREDGAVHIDARRLAAARPAIAVGAGVVAFEGGIQVEGGAGHAQGLEQPFAHGLVVGGAEFELG
jgi:hypothetical protein